jgi:hypothetical protein
MVEKSPHLEAFREKGYEVLIFSDPVDEVWLQSIHEFDGKPLKSAGKGTVDLGTEEEKSKAEEVRKEQQEKFGTLFEALQKKLDTYVKEVRPSSRLTSSLACLVGDDYDVSPQLAQMLKALHQNHDSEAQPIAPPDTEADAKPSPGVSHTGRPWAALMLGGTVLVVLGAAAMTRRRMVDDAVDVAEPTERAEVVASISSSLDALSEPGDDRAAIVAAYAALLDGLARAGRPRRPAEAPEEYVRRVLTGWSVRAEPLNELTALFEEARFSEHVLGSEHRARAMSALEAARAEIMALA